MAKESFLNAESVAKDYYGDKAALYDVNNINTNKWKNEERVITEWLKAIPKSGSILDVPCGTGRFFHLYTSNPYLGLDVSDEMLEQARTKLTRNGILANRSIFDLDGLGAGWNTTICVRLLNFFTSEECEKALDILGKVTRETLIFSLRTGDASLSSKRCNVHNFDLVRTALDNNDFVITDKKIVGKDNYTLYKAQIC